MQIPIDYEERVYAGVLGKIIGVYLGRPFEGWSYERIAAQYGYDTYGGNCHVVPNHGLIIHSLLYGDGDFQTSLLIANTSGWDTDCNSGNVGCLLGIRGGLAAIEAGPDWRGPVADRLYISSADATDAVTVRPADGCA
jgi:ADP-ribosylglycohydrolase